MTKEGGGSGAALAVAIGAALLGLSPIAIRLSEVGPQATSFWRFALALPILAALALRREGRPDRKQLNWLLIAGLLFGFEMSLWAQALTYTTVVNATLLSNMTPLVAAAFAWLLWREQPAHATYIGGGAALAGAVVLSIARAQSDSGPHGELGWLGDLLGFSAAFGYAAYFLILRYLGGRVGVGAVMFWATLGAALFAVFVTLVMGESFFPATPMGWAILVGNAVVVQVCAQGLIASGAGQLPIAISTVLLFIQPLAAAVLSWILFEETLGPLAFVGAAMILGGIWVVQRYRPAPPASPA